MNINRLFLVILIPVTIYAGNPRLLFEHISLQEGLSQSTINCIYQDKLGFMWFGTSNGLNKYDGYSFTVYHHNPSNSSSLSSDMINTIYEDSDGRLWVGTENGINLLNGFPEKFTRFMQSSVMTINEDNRGNLYAGSFTEGIFLYDKNKKSFVNIDDKNEVGINIWCSYKDKNGIIWYGTNCGLLKFDPVNKSKNFFQWEKENKTIYSIAEKDGILYLGTQGRGVRSFDIKNERFIADKKFENLSEQIKKFRVTSIFHDSNKRLWIGTMGDGLFLFNSEDGTFIKSSSDINSNSTLNDENISSVYEDNSGILWFGSSLSGIYKLALNKIKFDHYKKESGNPNSIPSNNIYALYKDHYGVVWVGSSAGLAELDRSKNKLKILSDKFVSSIIEDESYDLWVGTRSGLLKYDKFRNPVSLGLKDKLADSLLKETITDIIKDEKNNLWFLSMKGFIYSLDWNTKTLVRYFINKENKQNIRTFSFYKDSQGIFWIGTYNGLYSFNSASGESKVFRHNENDPFSLSNNAVFTVYEDKNGNIWSGTNGGGLNKYARESNRFYHYSEEQGLPNNVVYAIIPDKNDNLWLSTNKGICRFNISTNNVRTFDITDGLQSYEFNSGAYYLSYDGEMFFGGLNGFNSFYPDAVKDNPHMPSVVITSIKIFDKIYAPNVKELVLPYNSNFINFEFVSLDYLNPFRNKYKYKLEGFDKNFIEAKSRRFASYTNLEPGEYRFVVIGSNSDEVWNASGASVYFVINPPFWRTWWFYSLLIITVLFLLYMIYKFRVNQKLKQIAFVEQMRKRIADDFHDELGHKLTKISLYSQLMKKELDGKLNGSEGYLQKINETANGLYDDTKDFIWSVDPGKDTLYDLAVYLKDFGDELFDKTGISFRVNEIDSSLQKHTIPMHWKRQLILLFKEAMNNALKHSNCNNVELIISMNGFNFEFILKDDGEGISSDSEGKGRGMVNMKNRTEKIGGKLIIKTKSEGTTIKFVGNIQNTSVKNERNQV